MKRIGIDWQAHDLTGWGNLSIHLSNALLRTGEWQPVWLPGAPPQIVDASVKASLHYVMQHAQRLAGIYEPDPATTLVTEHPVLVSMGNRGQVCSTAFQGTPSIGLCYSEDTAILKMGSERMDKVLLGNNWACEVFKAAGVEQAELWQQGIDETVFFPRVPSGNYADRFVVYIGGQLSFRKGQDIALAAFKIFHEKHPDALLLLGVDSCWPGWRVGLDLAEHMDGDPGEDPLPLWLSKNGFAPDSYRVVGLMPHNMTPMLYRDVDVGLFTNRCEASTNMVAMELIAMGIPTILSNNTGHKDIPAAIRLREQGAPPLSPMYKAQEGWGESDVDEAVEALEKAYTRADITPSHKAFVRRWNWTARTAELLGIVDA